jgi:hypothetical protein
VYQNVLPNIKVYWTIPAITFFTFNSSFYFFPFSDFKTEPEVSFHHKVHLCIEHFSSKTKKRLHKISVCSNDAVFLFIHAHHSFLHIILCRRKKCPQNTFNINANVHYRLCICCYWISAVSHRNIYPLCYSIWLFYSEMCSTIASVELLHTGFYMNFILSTSSPCPFSC